MLNIIEPKNILSVIYFNPIPTVKLSNETKEENIIMFNKDSSYSSFSSFKDLIISISMIIKTVTKIYLGFTCIISIRMRPIARPNNGMTKWNIPTDIDVVSIVFLGMFNNPYARDNVKASMLKDNPIIINVIVSKKCHLFNYSDILIFYYYLKNFFINSLTKKLYSTSSLSSASIRQRGGNNTHQ